MTTETNCRSDKADARFGVRFSGHGSDFTPKHPLFNKTLEEATKEALDWELRADTIGGQAEIVTCLDFIDL